MFTQIGKLAFSLLFTADSEGSHIEHRVNWRIKNIRKSSKNDIRLHGKAMKMKIENCMLFRHVILMNLNDFWYHFWCQNGGRKPVKI